VVNQFRIILRNFFHKPVYSFITFTGFTIGVAASLLIYLWIRNELDFEKFHPDYNRIYRVLTLAREGDEVVKSTGCYRPLAKSLKLTYPQIENATYLNFDSEDSPFMRQQGGEKIEARCMSTNDDFFAVFKGFAFLEGTPEKAFSNPSNIVLSEMVARKLFGKEQALGKTIISNKYKELVYTVSGVVKIPAQSHIDFGCLIPESNRQYSYLTTSWVDRTAHVYIKLAKNALIDNQFMDRITNHLSRISRFSDKLMFQPLTEIHLHTDYQTNLFDKNISSYKYVVIFSGLAILIILMSVLNFSILSVARSSERATEIGMKKVCGAGRTEIIRHFMGEAIFQTLVATIVAICIIWLILPWFNSFTGQSLSLTFSFGLIVSLCLLTILAGILAGIYPSLYLASLKPMNIFHGGTQSGSGRNFARALVVIQFSIATFFIIATFIFVKQLNYIQGKDLGFDRKNIVVIPTGLWYENKAFKEELLRNPNILGVSATTYAPVDFNWHISLAVRHTNRIDSVRGSLIWVDEDFLKTYKLQLVKGQFLQMDFESFWEAVKADSSKKVGIESGLTLPAVINETAEKAFGFVNPIGERIGDFVIVGVVKDFHFRPLHYPIGPLVMTNNPENIMTMNIRIAENNRLETLKFISHTYRKSRNSRSFSFSYFDELLLQKYKDEIRLRNLTLLFSLLAVIISLLGILGMSVYSCDSRTREIGIRKANGASSAGILVMLNKDFLKWVVVAFIITCPVAWYVLYRWLDGFAYKTEMSWWIFALAGLLELGIAFLTVSWKSWKAATANPVESLKCE